MSPGRFRDAVSRRGGGWGWGRATAALALRLQLNGGTTLSIAGGDIAVPVRYCKVLVVLP